MLYCMLPQHTTEEHQSGMDRKQIHQEVLEAWVEHEYRRRTFALEQASQWELREMQTVDYIQEEGSQCKVLVYDAV